jgi:HTH-type transcriptional regulator / antitoxin HipB
VTGETRVPVPASALAATVRARRRELGLTQQDVADLGGVSAKFLRDFERGKATVRLDKLLDVLEVLGLELTAEVRR